MNSIFEWLVRKVGFDAAEYIGMGFILFLGIMMLVIRHVTIKLSNKYVHPKEKDHITDVTYTRILNEERRTVFKFTRRLFNVKISRLEYEKNECIASKSVIAEKSLLTRIQSIVENAGIKNWPSLSISAVPSDKTLFVAYGMVTYFMLNIHEQSASAKGMFSSIDSIIFELGLQE